MGKLGNRASSAMTVYFIYFPYFVVTNHPPPLLNLGVLFFGGAWGEGCGWNCCIMNYFKKMKKDGR